MVKDKAEIKNQSPDKDERRGRVRISIGTELISMISLILLISLSLMIFLATFFFKSDNEIRLKENNLKISEVISQKVKTDFFSIVETARSAAEKIETMDSSRKRGTQNLRFFADSFFARDQDIIFIGIAEKESDGKLEIAGSISNKGFLKRNKINAEKITQAINGESSVYGKSFETIQVVHNISQYFEKPIISISIPYAYTTETNASSILIVILSMNRFLDSVKSPGIVKTFIVNGEGDVIAHHDSSLVTASVNLKNLPIVKKMLTSPMNNTHTRYSDDKGIDYLGAFYKVGFAGTGIITSVMEETAYQAVYQIRKRNLLITVIVLSLSIIIVYIFSKTLIRPITSLVSATKEIERGIFQIEMSGYPRNELGMLMRSFQEMGRGLSERERMKDAFAKFVNPEIAEQVLKGEIRLGGERKTVAVFFSDIRSFTAISEKLEPEEVVEFLNEYMSRMVDCVNRTHGVVDKFIGDAVMATWGAPVSYGNDTENSVNASLLMRKTLIEYNRGRGGDRKPIIRIGCGINTGPVLAGQIGSQEKMEYTVIGDAVNLASRIESLNKPFGTDILISEDSYSLVKNVFAVEKMQQIKVKGKDQTQQIYAVLGRRDDPDCPKSVDEIRTMLGIKTPDLSNYNPDEKEEKFEIIINKQSEKKARPRKGVEGDK